MSTKQKADDVAATREEFAAYADRFRADAREKRDTSDFEAGVEEMRAAFADAGERFAAARSEFDRGVDRKVRDRRRVGAAFEDYAGVFADDVARKADVSALLSAFAATREEFETTRAEFAEFADAFGADVGAMREAVQALVDEFGAQRAENAEFAEAFAAGVREFEADDTKRRAFAEAAEDFLAARGEMRDAISEMWGIDREELDGMVENAKADREPRSHETAEATPSGTAGGTAGTDTESGTTEPEPDPEPATEPEPDPEPTTDSGVADSGAADSGQTAAEREALKTELREVQYGKLKKAANYIGYDGNLNAATKDELVDFIAQHADQVEEALREA